MLKVLEADFARLPELLGRAPSRRRSKRSEPEPEPRSPRPAEQLGLF